MKKVKIKIPAKINLTLDVFKKSGGYHPISSIVSSIDIYDTVILKERKDDRITLKEKGIKSGVSTANNNGYISAQKYITKHKTHGVDIIIKKEIPVGAGLGGSSADIAGVIKGIDEIYGKESDLISFANDLGSDSGYMINGGFAHLTGRGNIINKIQGTTLYLVIITENSGISTRECYNLFDSEKESAPCSVNCIRLLEEGNIEGFLENMKNDLYIPATKILPCIENNINALKNLNADKAIMTGSGSATLGLFTDKEKRDKVYKQLKIAYGKRVIKAQTI